MEQQKLKECINPETKKWMEPIEQSIRELRDLIRAGINPIGYHVEIKNKGVEKQYTKSYNPNTYPGATSCAWVTKFLTKCHGISKNLT